MSNVHSHHDYEPTALRARPSSFAELQGQEFVSHTLTESLKRGEIAHAYLFSGPRGVGKTSAARILAYRLNYSEEQDESAEAQEERERIRKGVAVDTIEIDGASHTSVNDVRQIREEVRFPPQRAARKVYIIDEVHMLSRSAFNALLKTIEEPPPYVVFIFATTELQKVPATVRSRCQHFHFRLLPRNVIREALARAAHAQRKDASDQVLLWIAKEARGSLRDAYTLFDQIASYREGLQDIAHLQAQLGTLSTDTLVQLATSIAEGEVEHAMQSTMELIHGGSSVEHLVVQLGEFYHALLLRKCNINDEAILGIPAESIAPALLERYNRGQIEVLLDELLETYRRLRYTIEEQYELEVLIAKLSSVHERVEVAELRAMMAHLERRGLLHALPPATPESTGASESAGYTPKVTAAPEVTASTASSTFSEPHPATLNTTAHKEQDVHGAPVAENPRTLHRDSGSAAHGSHNESSNNAPNAPNDGAPLATPSPSNYTQDNAALSTEQIHDIVARIQRVKPLLAVQLGRDVVWHRDEEGVILRVAKRLTEELIKKDRKLLEHTIHEVAHINKCRVILEHQPADEHSELFIARTQNIFQGEQVTP